ncbi:response regulator [Nocardia pseudobrasiliensis]|uniref:LuxR family two component transcriptional regulator n=1 Tax=Nocardia pseudobrasiliensis TaxID=45979 RepID=A0A370I9I7_9NOCA|nr:response regulator transcription factor [Nocardia pseudobrasiliensis]RDI67377.1 LuxR family two component transcriptional regulator [Nocardia pseudobrasiliensis]
MISVLVVDDLPLIRAGLVTLLNADPDLSVAGEAGDGERAVALAAQTKPDVVVMDIRMPGVNGIAATRRILAECDPRPRILVLTTFDLDEYVFQALRAGASGFILKDSEPERLLGAIRSIAEGDMLFAPTVTRRLIENYLRQGESAEPALCPELEALTTREREILRLVGTGAGNNDIARRLSISEGTVKTHVNRVMTKLELNSRAQAVVAAYESGLVTPRCPGG